MLSDPKDPDFPKHYIDENEKQLCDFPFKKGDSFTYWYDYGDDWFHTIEILDFMDTEPLLTPHCLLFNHVAPTEDSRGDWLIESWKAEHPTNWLSKEDGVRYCKGLNEQFQNLRFELAPFDFIQKEASRLEKKLLNLATSIKQEKPWTLIDSNQILVFQDPFTEEYYYCTIMGHLGEVLGIAVYVGEAGYSSLKKIQSELATVHEQDALLLTFNNRKDIDPNDYNLIKHHGFSFRGKQAWPTFRNYKPGYYPWYLSIKEMTKLCYALEQLLIVLPKAKKRSAIFRKYISRWGTPPFN